MVRKRPLPSGPQAFQPMEMIAVAIARRICEPQLRQAREQDRQSDIELKSRQGRADAKMDASAEAHMRVGRSSRIELIGRGKALLIAIGGAEQQAHRLAFLQLKAVIVDILEGVAAEEMQGRIEAQQLLDMAFAEFGSRLACLEQSLDAIADRMDGRLVSGIEQQDRCG